MQAAIKEYDEKYGKDFETGMVKMDEPYEKTIVQPTTDISKPKLLGFSETLKTKVEQSKKLPTLNPNICQNIFVNGSKVNKKYFYPSEFPKLTKIKPITVSIKRGGKRKSRKLFKNKK